MTTDMIYRQSSGTAYYRFPKMAELTGFSHAVFTRNGGDGNGSASGLNVSFAAGNDPEQVLANRRRIAELFGDIDLACVNQVHGVSVRQIKRPLDSFNGIPDAGPGRGAAIDGDAMITDEPGIGLLCSVADCQPVILVDPVKKACANVHSGWRGSIGNIIGSTVFAMNTAFGTNPIDIHAGIGPSLGPCCAEFREYKKEIPETFWPYRDERHYFDFWEISRDQLKAAGVRPEHIEMSGLCTRCRTDLFFSYRGEKETGRFGAVVVLR